MVEAGGVAGLTVRGLASKLSVAVTSIYWHVGDKDALYDGVAGLIIERFGKVTVRGAEPEARLRSAARSLRRMLSQRPELVALVHQVGRTAELIQPARRVVVAELRAAGVDDEAAALAVQGIVNLVVGSVLLDRQVERQPVQRETAEDLWRDQDLPDAPGLLAALRRPVDEEALFDYLLGVLVQSVLQQRTGSPAGTPAGRQGTQGRK